MDKSVYRSIKFFYLNNSIVFIFIALCIFTGVMTDRFFTLRNWLNILNNFSILGIVAFGVSLVVLAGGIDLSFGSILACCAILATFLQPYGLVVPIIAAIALGGGLGALNGFLVAKVGLNPLISTLGTQWLYFAVLLIFTGGNLVQGQSGIPFSLIGHGQLLRIPVPIYLFILAGIATWLLTRRTLFGKYLYAHGSNKQALYCSGVKANDVYLKAFVVMGLLVGLAGVMLSSRLIGVRPTEGGRYLITVLTAVILGGISLNGGIGSIPNVLVAVMVLGVIDNAMVLLAVPYKDQQIIRGSIFIFSIIYNNYLINRSEMFRRKCYQQSD